MTSSQKTLYGILAFLPFAMAIVLVVQIAAMIPDIIPAAENNDHPEQVVFAHLVPIIVTGMITGLASLVSIVLYIVHAINNKSLESTERTMWILLFVFIHSISAIIYFFIRIMKEQSKVQPQHQN